jgi:hypothetical protein
MAVLKDREFVNNHFDPGGWKRITGTAHATPGTETTHAHGLGRVPVGVLFFDADGSLFVDEGVYLGADAEAAGWDATNIYVKATAVSDTFVAWVI